MKRRIDEIKTKERLRRSLGDLSQLKSSIQEVGLLQPIIINERDELISGFRRLEACRQMGWPQIDVIAIDTGANPVRMLDMEFHENMGRVDFPTDIIEAYEKRRHALLNPPKTPKRFWKWLQSIGRFIKEHIRKIMLRG